MNKSKFSDDQLRSAAISVEDSLLESLPPPSSCDHKFSRGFEQKMNAALKEEKHHHLPYLAKRSIAALFLAAAILVGTWLSLDVEAQASFLNWIRETYKTSIVYHFFNNGERTALVQYQLSWIPEGFEQTDGILDDTFSSEFYLHPITGDSFLFEYASMSSGFHIELLTNHPNTIPDTVTVQNQAADYYPAEGSSNANNLIWIDENTNTVFSISSNLDKSVILNIATGVVLVE